jgi:CxxC-x17-CxxC domain-containing protein
MGHQYIEQLSEKVKFAVFGNVGTLVVFRVGATDAEELVKEFTPVFTEEDLVNLPKYNVVLKLMIDGIASDPFSARGLAPLTEQERTGNEEAVIEATRKNYSGQREEVEDSIMRWHQVEEEAPRPKMVPNPAPATNSLSRPSETQVASTNTYQKTNAYSASNQEDKPKVVSENIYTNEATCARCGKQTRVSFKPDGIRPVYCKDCLAILREEKAGQVSERKRLKEMELMNLQKDNQPNNKVGPTISLRDIPKRSEEAPNLATRRAPTTPDNDYPSGGGTLQPGQTIKL